MSHTHTRIMSRLAIVLIIASLPLVADGIRHREALGASSDGFHRQRGGAAHDRGGIGEPRVGPRHRGYDLGRTHMAVAVGVDDGQRSLVDLESLESV